MDDCVLALSNKRNFVGEWPKFLLICGKYFKTWKVKVKFWNYTKMLMASGIVFVSSPYWRTEDKRGVHINTVKLSQVFPGTHFLIYPKGKWTSGWAMYHHMFVINRLSV